MNRIVSYLLLAGLLLGACSPSATPPTGSDDTPQPTRTPRAQPTAVAQTLLPVKEEELKGLSINVWYPWYGVEASLFDSLVKEFNAQNSWGINVTAKGQVNFTNLYEDLNAALPTADRPDMVIALPEEALEWDDERVVTDLTPYVDDPLYGMDSGDIPFVFWNQDETSARVRVAVPAQRTVRFLLWNGTWAGKLGFDSPPDTPDDFRQQACRAHESMLKDESAQNDFMGGWLVDTDPMTAYAWLLAFEGGVLEGNDYRFLTPNNILAFTFLRGISESSCAWQLAGVEPIEAFAQRQAVFISASLEDLPNVARALAADSNTDSWKVIAFPGANQDALVVYGSSYVVLQSTEAKQLASWLFIRWLLDNTRDARFVEATHLFPIRSSTLGLLADYEKTHPQWAQAVDLLPLGEVQPQLASWRIVKVMLGDGFTHMYRVNVPSGQVAAILAQMESISRDITK